MLVLKGQYEQTFGLGPVKVKFCLLQQVFLFGIVPVPGAVKKPALCLIGKHDHPAIKIQAFFHNTHHFFDEGVDIQNGRGGLTDLLDKQ